MKRIPWVWLSVSALALSSLACNMLTSRLGATPAPGGNPPRATAPAATAPPAGQGALPIKGGPAIGSPRETRIAIQGGTDAPTILEQLAEETYSSEELAQVGETFNFTIALPQNEQVLWVYGWCATSQELVDQNLENMRLDFTVNGTGVALEQFYMVESQSGDLPCRTYAAVVYDWPRGETTLETVVTFQQTVNDGMADYPPGTQSFVYTVTAP